MNCGKGRNGAYGGGSKSEDVEKTGFFSAPNPGFQVAFSKDDE